jgi:MFS transporter, DHA2 family, methylenomycin A resistance protein
MFLPMMLIGAALAPFSARVAERLGRKTLITFGLSLMTVGLVVPASIPLWVLSALMIPVGLGGPLVMPPVTGSVPPIT